MYPLQNGEESTMLWKKTPFLIVIWWPVFLFWECESEPRHYRSDLGALTGGADPEYRRLLTALSGAGAWAWPAVRSVVCQRQVMESGKEAAFPFPPLPKAISFSFLAENDVSVTVFSFKVKFCFECSHVTRDAAACNFLVLPGTLCAHPSPNSAGDCLPQTVCGPSRKATWAWDPGHMFLRYLRLAAVGYMTNASFHIVTNNLGTAEGLGGTWTSCQDNRVGNVLQSFLKILDTVRHTALRVTSLFFLFPVEYSRNGFSFGIYICILNVILEIIVIRKRNKRQIRGGPVCRWHSHLGGKARRIHKIFLVSSARLWDSRNKPV